jgi:hypothetical protein
MLAFLEVRTSRTTRQNNTILCFHCMFHTATLTLVHTELFLRAVIAEQGISIVCLGVEYLFPYL